MFKKRIIYRLLIVLLVFALTFIIPLFFRINVSINAMFDEFGRALVDYSGMKTDLKKRLFNDIVVMSFYTFFIGFLLSLFFSRKIVLPVKKLFKGAEAIRRGNFEVALPVLTDDELGEVTATFNRMAKSIKEHTRELKKKDVYIRNMVDPMWVTDLDNIIIDVNPAFTKLFGYERDEILGLSVFDFVDEENAIIMKYELENRGQKSLSAGYQVSMTAKDGRQTPVLITSTQIREEDEITGKIGVIKDFSEQAGLMDRLVESKKELEAIMNSIEDDMLLIDGDYRIINANAKALKIYGENIIGRNCYSVSHKNLKPCWVFGNDCPVQKVLVYGGTWKTVHEHFDRMGLKHYDEIMACPVKDIDGKIAYVVEVIRDVTENKKFEETISRKNAELSTLNKLSSIISGSLKADEIFSEVIAVLTDIFDMDGGGIYLLDPNNRVLNCVYHKGLSEDFVASAGKVRVGDDIPGRVVLTGEGIMITDMSRDYRGEKSVLRYSDIKGYCCIPIRGKERIIGVFCLFRFKEHFFIEEEVRILTSVGEMAGMAIENINLYEKVRGLFDQQRQRRIQEQRLLIELASRITSSFDINQSIKSIIVLIRNYFKTAAAWYALAENQDDITIEVVEGIDMKENEKSFPKDVVSIENTVVKSGEYMIIEDLFTETGFFIPAIITQNNFRTAVSVPVKMGGRVYGVVTLFYRNITVVKEEDIHFLLILVNMLSVSIETAELYEKRIMDKGLAETVLDSVSEGVCTIDVKGFVTSANNVTEKIFGLPATKIIDRHYTEVISYDRNSPEYIDGSPVSKALRGERAVGETKLSNLNGPELILQIGSSPLLDPKGNVKGAVLVIRDVTREKAIDRMKSELIRNVSHEFRTPLSAIVGMTEMIRDGDVAGDRVKEYLNIIYSEGRRLSNMVSDLLDLSKIESGREVLNESDIDVSGLLREVEKTLEKDFKEKGAVLGIDVEQGLTSIYADRSKLKQIFVNLINNSLTYSEKGVKIDVTIKKYEDFIIIVIEDNGWGISKNDLLHIGEKFFRGANSDETKGTGLGVSLCKEMIQMHNGIFDIKSKWRKGTTITIKLPIRKTV